MKTYKQTLKTLSVMGIVLLVLSFALSIFTTYSSSNIDIGTYHIYSYLVAIPQFTFLFMYLGSVLLTLRAFKYLNKREESDFYDSLPEKKIYSFFQRILAVLTYQFSIIIVSILGVALSFALKDIPIMWDMMTRVMLAYIAGSVLMVGGLSLAKTLTGTDLSTLALGFTILFLPKIILTTVPMLINATTSEFIPLNNIGILFDIKYNIPVFIFTFIVNPFEGYYLNLSSILSKGAIIYSTLLGLVYIAISAFFIRRRRSELAGKGCLKDISGYIQSILLVLPILILFIYPEIVYYFFNSNSMPGIGKWLMSEPLLFVVLLFFVYLAFNLVYTRKLKSILKSMPFYLISVALCAGIFVSSSFIANKIKYRVPQVEDIEYVTITKNPDNYFEELGDYSYRDLLNSDTQFTDSEMINMMHSALNDFVNPTEYSPTFSNRGNSGQIGCTFNLKSGGTMTRIITIPSDDTLKFRDLLHANTTYYENSISIPPRDYIRYIDFFSYHMEYDNMLTQEQINEIWDTYVEELPRVAKENYPNYYDNSHRYKSFVYAKIFGKYEGDYFFREHRFTSREEDTTNLVLTMLSESGIDIHNSWDDVVSNLDDYEGVRISMQLVDMTYAYTTKGDESTYKFRHVYSPLLDDVAVDRNMQTQVQLDKILDVIDGIDYKDIDCAKCYISISYSYTTLDGETLPKNVLFLSLTDEQASQIYHILTKDGEK